MRIAVVTVRPAIRAQFGGAERLFDALTQAFRALGHETDELAMQVDEGSFEGIKRGYLSCYDLDVSKYDMVVSTKAPTWMVRHPRHVCYLVHTMRVFYDMFDATFPSASPDQKAQRALIHQLDTGALSPARCRKIFAIGEEVSTRLRDANRLPSGTMHPPLWKSGFRDQDIGDYFFLPGRLHRWKRVDLVIDAFMQLDGPLQLLIAGQGEEEEALRRRAASDTRIRFLGAVSDEQLVELYSRARAVPFTPVREDYGYVTLEAFASGRPVVTCTDSGEASAIVKSGVNGLVVAPDPGELSRALGRIAADAELARSLGKAGKAWVEGLSWQHICEELISAARPGESR